MRHCMIERRKMCIYVAYLLIYWCANLSIMAIENEQHITRADSLSLNNYIFKADSLLKIAQIDSAIFYTQKVDKRSISSH